MAHLTNPSGFRPGKSFLWSNNSLTTFSNTQVALDSHINLGAGLEKTLNNLLKKRKYWLVKSSLKYNIYAGNIPTLKILYYPLFYSVPRQNRLFPLFSEPRRLVHGIKKYTPRLKKFIKKFWKYKKRIYKNRLVYSKKKKNLNRWITKTMFKGTYFKKLLPIKNKFSAHGTKRSYRFKKFKNRFIKKQYLVLYKKLKNKNWFIRHKYNSYLNPYLLSNQLSKRIGIQIHVKVQNIFDYLLHKKKFFNKKTHQLSFWNKKYHMNKTRFLTYYDIVNSFYILCFIPYTENLIIQMIQYSFLQIRKKSIKPKFLFYFMDSVLKNMKAIRRSFNAIKIIITGKLRGGTARTNSFSIGFGNFPVQTLSENIHYEFGNIESKYGSFGVKIWTWRKSDYKVKMERVAKWKRYHNEIKHKTF